ncbi:MAG: LrgB family protein [Hahellaceae bacterium]|nr:LrgB family protein [Hahellaceae bacterium]
MPFWVYFSAQPLFWLIITLLAYQLCCRINRVAGATPLLHPVILTLTLLISFLLLTGTHYETYFAGAQFIHFLLGPATVALAIPLYDHRRQIRSLWKPITIACLSGASTAALTALLVGLIFDLPDRILVSLAPKSVTSPIALGIADKLGGYPSLAAGLVLITGAIGCVLAPWIFRWLNIQDDAIKGFTLGLGAHGFGTASAFGISVIAGAFGGLAMGLTGLLTAFLLPLLLGILGIHTQ